MSEPLYNPMIVSFEGIKVSGLINRNVSFASASRDCPALWEELQKSVKFEGMDSYGVSSNMTPMGFDYLAGVAALLSETLRLDDFTSLDIPAGAYARCSVPKLEAMGEVYRLLYEENWPSKHTRYTVNMLRPCFELYPAPYNGGTFYIYAPVDEKS